jgi:hypothetical protein
MQHETIFKQTFSSFFKTYKFLKNQIMNKPFLYEHSNTIANGNSPSIFPCDAKGNFIIHFIIWNF